MVVYLQNNCAKPNKIPLYISGKVITENVFI